MSDLGQSTREFYLAHRRDGETSMQLVIDDGSHETPEGVAEAAKLYSRIFGNDGPWVMVEVLPMPDLDPPINEADAALLRSAVAESRMRRAV